MTRHAKSLSEGVTVPEVMKALGLEPEPHVSWSIGARVREEYVATMKAPPPKALRPKTSGSGSHCFAVYPPEMVPLIERIVGEHKAAAARQGSLF
jgi:hypothetical protein